MSNIGTEWGFWHEREGDPLKMSRTNDSENWEFRDPTEDETRFFTGAPDDPIDGDGWRPIAPGFPEPISLIFVDTCSDNPLRVREIGNIRKTAT